MLEQQLQLCPSCQRNMHLNFYCESCHSSFCSDCIKEVQKEFIICAHCGSQELSRNKEGILTCDKCFNQNTSKVYKNVKICPKCNSTFIVKVFDKKKDINDKFIQLIRKTRAFAVPFRNIIDKLSLLRNKLKKIRDPPIRCYHFPSLESELISIYRLFLHVKREVSENIKREFNHIYMNKDYFIDISTQPNNNIPIITGILENLNHEHESLSIFIENNLNKILESIQEIDTKLKYLEDILKKFQKFGDLIEFTRDEKALYALKCKMTKGYNPTNEYSNARGTLLISNLYIYYINEYGLLRKKANIILKIPHTEFKRIQIIGTIRKRLYMEFVYGKYYFSISSKKRKNVIDYIENARVFDQDQIFDMESAKSLMLIKLDVKDLIDFIETNISYILNLKCNHNIYYQSEFKPNSESYRNYNYPQQNYSQTFKNDFQQAQFQQPNRNFSNQYNPYFDENNILMRRLGDCQRPINDNNMPNYPENSYNNQDFASQQINQFQKRNYSQDFNNMNFINPRNLNQRVINQRYQFQDQHRQQAPSNNQYLDKRTQLLELEKEEFSLTQTLQLMDKRFDQGTISEVDYFKPYRRYLQELYIIQRKIEDLKKAIKEEEELQKLASNF